MTRKKLVQYIGLSLTPWYLVFLYVANYLWLDIFPTVCFLILVALAALAVFGLGLFWWAERKWAA